ncbi:site-specific DNA-methyltransferase [Weissella hellenica]|uniref:Adenine-specific DNA-methyltransferase n=1 Tax=Weissella hellenica TaxID=46256 RepID=A0A4Y4G4R3_WEIHE|nr:site-specific DNA-methyltransferase [Weissella hellenica]NKY66894.1 site-specific DNA-methyltransferase [Weissella hellenica]GED35825.1 type III restriction endonuclease StyLTI [Weissella hellenica]SCB88234.1 adenine-specific DNA-methyltransferase [Weissella hellenica]
MVDFKQILTEDNTEPNTEFLKQLRSKLPEFFTQDKYGIDKNGKEVVVEAGGFDIQKFQTSLSNHNVNEIVDGYTLNFVGKKYAELQVGKPTASVIIPDMNHNNEPKNAQSENIFLTGDNLNVLKHLQQAYTNSIDMIYLDPPYNTGSDGFVYNDNFDLSDEDLRNILNMSEDEINKIHLLNGRSSHSAWLTFMYPRLKIAQQLLKDSGIIFVSIDEHEYANLKLLLDHVFGENSYLGDVIRKTRSSANDTSNGFNQQHEYVFIYGKNARLSHIHGEIKDNSKYKNPDNDPSGAWVITDPSARSGGPNSSFQIVNPKNGHVDTPPAGRYWAFSRSTFDKWVEQGKVVFKDEVKEGQRGFFVKKYLYELKNEFNTVNSLFGTDNRFMNQAATKYLRDELFDGNDYFSSPKPVELIKNLVKYSTNQDSLILDFFAGSATTADAVMQLNAEDGGNRKWILNTLDEKTPDDSNASKAGYLTIDEIARERIKRSGKKIKKEHPDLGVHFDSGFKHYYIKEMNASTIDKIVDFDPNNIQLLTDDVVSEFSGNAVKLGKYYEKSDKDKVNPKFAKVVDTGATGENTILQTWLINDGYKLDVLVKTIELVHNNVHYVEDGSMIYIIDQFTQEDVEALLNIIGTHQLNVKTIIVFGYSFDFATMTSLKNNVKTALDGVRVEVRY